MAAAFRAVNTHLTIDAAKSEDKMTTPPTTPTPRPSTAPHSHQQPQPQARPDDATTPTRASFGNNALASQKPLPSSPFPDAVQIPESAENHKMPTRDNSRQSKKFKESEDVDMDDSDGDTAAGDDAGASDDESTNGDDPKSGKKKKSQRFYCTDYPPCNLSFTRSEHLARHIRKHTGERPFQCHCSRRFSRLDNLRQHAQTVHVNEDIPIDSLAATGARFQRQIRTERVRQPGPRSRPPTSGSVNGPPTRGHSKSLSTSSIGSVSSVGSAYVGREDVRRRPPPLIMADPRSRGSFDGYRGSDGSYVYRPATPTEFSTPTSATFSTGQSSPRWGSVIASPTTSHSRSHSLYSSGARTPGRRLSVPSGTNPFQSPHGAPVNRPTYGPSLVNPSNSGAFSPATSSVLASPTSPSWSNRRDSASSAAEEAWRRRTWHPDSRGFNPNASSHLSNVVTASQYQSGPPPPLASSSNPPQHNVRLPGIESFDPLPPRPASPSRRQPSPMMVEREPVLPHALPPGTDPGMEDRRNSSQWDMGLHRGLTRLDLRSSNLTPPRDSAGAWANEVNQAVQAQAEQARSNQPTVRFEIDAPPPSQSNSNAFRNNHQHTMSAPSIATSRENKRHGWYHGPIAVHHPPEGAPSHPGQGPHVDRMEHPNMTAFRGFSAREAPREEHGNPPQGQSQPGGERPGNGSSSRFDALVAVAASEGNTAAAY